MLQTFLQTPEYYRYVIAESPKYARKNPDREVFCILEIEDN